MTYLYIVFVGHTKDRIIKSIQHFLQKYPPALIQLIVGQSSGVTRSREVAQSIADELRAIFEMEIVTLENTHPIRATIELLKILAKFKGRNLPFLVDFSGSLPHYALTASYLAHILRAKIVSVDPLYDPVTQQEVDVERFHECEPFPLHQIKKIEGKFLTSLGGTEMTIQDLVKALKKHRKGTNETIRRYIYTMLDNLAPHRLIEVDQSGYRTKLQLTPLGELYAEAVRQGFM